MSSPSTVKETFVHSGRYLFRGIVVLLRRLVPYNVRKANVGSALMRNYYTQAVYRSLQESKAYQ